MEWRERCSSGYRASIRSEAPTVPAYGDTPSLSKGDHSGVWRRLVRRICHLRVAPLRDELFGHLRATRVAMFGSRRSGRDEQNGARFSWCDPVPGPRRNNASRPGLNSDRYLSIAVVEQEVHIPGEHQRHLFAVGMTLLIVPGLRIGEHREDLARIELQAVRRVPRRPIVVPKWDRSWAGEMQHGVGGTEGFRHLSMMKRYRPPG
jgi:hypothetical protein